LPDQLERAAFVRALARLRHGLVSRFRRPSTDTVTQLLRMPRSAYGAVWDTLAETEEQAKFNVSGFTDEAAYEATAEATRRVLEASVGIRTDDEILEIGCGVGRVGRALSPHCRRWTGTDVSPRMLAHAARRLRDCPNVRFVAINGRDLGPVPTASADLVYCTVVFMHLDEWERFTYVKDAYRVLRPAGRIYVDNIDLCSNEGWAIFEECAGIAPDSRLPHTSRASTEAELETYLGRAAFTTIRVERRDGWVRAWGLK
jgi:SAM-dependent methyltransferase